MTTVPLWRKIQRENFTNWKHLAEFLELPPTLWEELVPHSSWPLNLPRRLATKMAKGTLEDPLLRQFVPLKQEKLVAAGFCSDPVGDLASQKTKKLLHKYHGRALLMPSSACAMHCRYCFRREYEHAGGQSKSGCEEELALLAADPSIEEVILSGGDPLSLGNAALGLLLDQLEAIAHVKRVRFHTRFPIGIPERIDEELLILLQNRRYQIFLMIHSNHPSELDKEVLAALRRVGQLGIPLLCQTVLLRGVNNQLEILATLFGILINHGILPYYLHQMDRVTGAAHFELPESEGLELMQQLQAILPGYGVPKYVREVAGEPHKTPLV